MFKSWSPSQTSLHSAACPQLHWAQQWHKHIWEMWWDEYFSKHVLLLKYSTVGYLHLVWISDTAPYTPFRQVNQNLSHCPFTGSRGICVSPKRCGSSEARDDLSDFPSALPDREGASFSLSEPQEPQEQEDLEPVQKRMKGGQNFMVLCILGPLGSTLGPQWGCLICSHGTPPSVEAWGHSLRLTLVVPEHFMGLFSPVYIIGIKLSLLLGYTLGNNAFWIAVLFWYHNQFLKMLSLRNSLNLKGVLEKNIHFKSLS